MRRSLLYEVSLVDATRLSETVIVIAAAALGAAYILATRAARIDAVTVGRL